MSDGLEGYDGDPGLKLRGGQWVSPSELRDAGIASWDSNTAAAAKLQRMRDGKLQPGPLTPAEVRRSGGRFLFWLGILALVPVVAVTMLLGWRNVVKAVGPRAPTTQFEAMPMASWQEQQTPASELKRLQDEARGELKATLGHLYKPGTSFKGIFAHCAAKPCTRPDHSAYRAYRRHAVNPASYDSDLCRAMVPARLPDAARLKQEAWMVSHTFSGETACELVDAAPVLAAYEDKLARAGVVLAGMAGVVLFGLVWLWRRSRAAGPVSPGTPP